MKPMDPDVRLLSALADPVRLSFVRQLAETDCVCACDFSECCTVSQPTISHHLKVLRDAGVVTSERRGTNVVYSLAPDFAAALGRHRRAMAGLVPRRLRLRTRGSTDDRYARAGPRAIRNRSASGISGTGACCGPEEGIGAGLYSELERADLPDAAVLASLGCGNPTAVADLHAGERVLDLGSGGGIDVLLSAASGSVRPDGRSAST